MIIVHQPDGVVNLVKPTGTVLQSLEKASVRTTSHCKGGMCGMCRMKLKSGNVTYATEPLGYMDEGEFLPCICFADSDVEIQIDA